jgi:prepilin-type processing-associated H-X9-DG protein
MNLWASAKIDGTFLVPPLRGERWQHCTPRADRMILLVEAWSYLGTNNTGFAPPIVVGGLSTPGARLGGGGGLTPFNTRFGPANADVNYARHRRPNGPGTRTEARGRAAIAFADGHVEMLRNDELVAFDTGELTGRAYWSRRDF